MISIVEPATGLAAAGHMHVSAISQFSNQLGSSAAALQGQNHKQLFALIGLPTTSSQPKHIKHGTVRQLEQLNFVRKLSSDV